MLEILTIMEIRTINVPSLHRAKKCSNHIVHEICIFTVYIICDDCLNK